MNYVWGFRFLWDYLPALGRAALVTLLLTAIAVVAGTFLGIILAWARSARFWGLRCLSAAVVEVGLALPLLVLLIWLYHCLPQLSARLTFDGFSVAAVALSVNLAPFVGETIRSGFASLPRKYALAARASGMTSWQCFWRIVLPLATRRVLPALVSHYVTALKLVSICSVIAVPEIVYVSQAIIHQERRPVEVYTVMGLVYIGVVLPFTLLARLLERKLIVQQ